MKTIILTPEEKQDIQTIVNKYKSLYNYIEILEKTLTKIENNKTKLLSELDNLREKENKLISSIVDKYGKGKFNVDSMNYEID